MNGSSVRFQLRAFASVFISIAFVVLITSGGVLFISPPGRVANWTNWAALGLRKSEWTALHVCFSVLFLAGAALHLAYNLRPLLGYLRDRLTRRFGFRREWVVAAAASGLVAVGTLRHLPPFTTFLSWNEAIKESWDQPADRAPIPHAELLTIAALAEKAGIDTAAALHRLEAAGLAPVEAGAIVQTIATQAHRSAQQIYDVIRGATTTTPGPAAGAGGGVGWKTLPQFCTDEGIDPNAARARLAAKGIVANEGATLREIALKAGCKPYELVTLIRAGS